jgi:putative ABC transport system permease protein
MTADSETVLSAMRASSFKSVTVRLAAPEQFAQFKKSLTGNPALTVDAMRETDYLAAQSKQLNRFLVVVAYLVGGIIGLGALNTLHAAGSLVFRLSVTPSLIAEGVAFACVLGLIGGLFPALRAARVSVSVALRTN